ncbi:RNA polymerase sigma factor [Oceanibacterium hippocampi]|uniref:ECF RNA polymerase sigma factor SigH n=1 Tax=Oceanibacterium hippocampi TaxID=745714 RepID=A0A1Y5TD47_9PROT|nr:sigma-70 family RNA polymerase sigma factor [Oceanibacterium hippocampi]SLN57681.1 ECF RNA polymerase sigma factor SigH [Oceanibacterium hippocampi]
MRRAMAGRQNLRSKLFWQVWREHQDYLYRLSLRWMSGNVADAEDAMNAAAVKAVGKFADSADEIRNARAWLARLLHNHCIDVHRANQRRNDQISEVKSMQDGDVSVFAAAPRSPEEELWNTQLARELDSAIRELPNPLRSAFTLRLVQGEDYPEIAAQLRISNENVRKRVQQARALLRQRLAGYRKEMNARTR